MNAEIDQQVIDYTTVQFPSLPRLDEIVKEEYFGPHPESNKVLPGMYAGAFPGVAEHKATNDKNLIDILNTGITTFVCLQQEYPVTNRNVFHFGNKVNPYFNDVLKFLAVEERHSKLTTDTVEASFVHFPIRDMSTTEDYKIIKLCKDLVRRYHRGEVLYIHCWGGHGRTGVVVCIMLHLMYGLTGDEVLERCEFVHRIRKSGSFGVSSPQTLEQKIQVSRIIKRLCCNKSIHL
jgi:hypothetical protein